MSFLAELKRRNIFRAAVAYLVASWLIVEVVSTILPLFDTPTWVPRTIVVVLAIAFVPALILAWVFEWTPEGFRREKDVARDESITPKTAKRLDRIIIVALVVALGYFALDKFVLEPRRLASELTAAREEARKNVMVESRGDNSIAVLPFVDMSPDKDQGYFSDGLAEELLNVLARIPQLRVTSRSSAFSLKDRNLEIAEIGKLLHVAHVLEGSVRKAGERIRITTQLIDVRNDTPVWSETYDRTLDDIFAVQDEISSSVVEHLKVSLLGEAPRVKRVNPKVFELFLQARELGRLHTQEGYERSVALYRQGLAIDSAYAPAWSGLAYNYRRQANNGFIPMEEGYGLALDAANHALQIDPAFAPAHAELGRIALDHDGDLAGAARHFAHAHSLEPTNSDITGYCAILSDSLGRIAQGIALNESAIERDPANPTLRTALGIEYRYARRFDDAIRSFRAALALSPGEIGTHYRMGEALVMKGNAAAALAEFNKEPLEAWRMIGLPLAYHGLQQQREADTATSALLEKHAKGWPFNIAYVFAWRGDADRAFEFLDKAIAEHDPSLSDLASETLFEKIRQDARWRPFLKKVGRAPEQLAAVQFDVKPPR